MKSLLLLLIITSISSAEMSDFEIGHAFGTRESLISSSISLVALMKLDHLSNDGKEVAWIIIDSNLLAIANLKFNPPKDREVYDILVQISNPSSNETMKRILLYRHQCQIVNSDKDIEKRIKALYLEYKISDSN